jgi:hypothetical protein
MVRFARSGNSLSGMQVGNYTTAGDTGTPPQMLNVYGGGYVSGNLGVGTKAPDQKLTVDGNLRIANTLYSSSGRWIQFGAPPSHTAMLIPGFGGGTSSGAHTDWPPGWGGGIATWDIVGAQTFFSAYITRSDKRLKEDIHPLERKLFVEKLRKLVPISYKWKDKRTPQTQLGFIAQDVREIWPELVTGEESETTYLGLNYDSLIAPLVLAVQSLMDDNEAMKARVDTLPSTSAPASGITTIPLLLASLLFSAIGMCLGYCIGRRTHS